MRPFPGRGAIHKQKIYTYRLSRARRIVENAFGILAARWRIYHSKIAVKPQTVNEIVKASCVLHNMLQAPSILEEAATTDAGALQSIAGVGNGAATNAIDIQNNFKEFFAADDSVPWQHDYVRRGIFTD